MQLSAGFVDASRCNRCGGIANSGEAPTVLEPPGPLSDQPEQKAALEGAAGVGPLSRGPANWNSSSIWTPSP